MAKVELVLATFLEREQTGGLRLRESDESLICFASLQHKIFVSSERENDNGSYS